MRLNVVDISSDENRQEDRQIVLQEQAIGAKRFVLFDTYLGSGPGLVYPKYFGQLIFVGGEALYDEDDVRSGDLVICWIGRLDSTRKGGMGLEQLFPVVSEESQPCRNTSLSNFLHEYVRHVHDKRVTLYIGTSAVLTELQRCIATGQLGYGGRRIVKTIMELRVTMAELKEHAPYVPILMKDVLQAMASRDLELIEMSKQKNNDYYRNPYWFDFVAENRISEQRDLRAFRDRYLTWMSEQANDQSSNLTSKTS